MYIFLHKESNNMYNKKVNELLTSIYSNEQVKTHTLVIAARISNKVIICNIIKFILIEVYILYYIVINLLLLLITVFQ